MEQPSSNIRQLITRQILLRSHQLTADIEKNIRRETVRTLEGKIVTSGYIHKVISVKSHSQGTVAPHQMTGGVLYNVIAECDVIVRPYAGQELVGIVVKKSELGIEIVNYEYPCYVMFVHHIHEDPVVGVYFEQLSVSNQVKVSVVDSAQAAPSKEHPKACFWILCSITEIKVDAIRKLVLPTPRYQGQALKTIDVQPWDDDETNMFTELKLVKEGIDELNARYNRAMRDKSRWKRDLITNARLRRHGGETVIWGIINNIEDKPDDKQLLLVDVKHAYKYSEDIDTIKLLVDSHRDHTLGAVIEIRGSDLTNTRVLELWSDHIKYTVNQFERIRPSPDYVKQLNLPRDINQHAINRAYYKMVEFLGLFPEILPDQPINIACIAEHPGGFIQCLIDARREGNTFGQGHGNVVVKDKIKAISVPPDGILWKDIQIKLHRDMRDLDLTLLGQEDDGDILVKENRDKFVAKVGPNGAHLVTADAGTHIDKVNAVRNEMDISHLIMAEVLLTIQVQALNGNAIIKFFDTVTKLTTDVIQVLAHCYEKISIVKPRTSRNASSEKYIVCQDFRADDSTKNDMIGMLEIAVTEQTRLNQSYRHGEERLYVQNLFNVNDGDLKTALDEYNRVFLQKQISFIRDGVSYGEQYLKMLEDNSATHDDFVHSTKITTDVQELKATEFTNTFLVPTKTKRSDISVTD
jgi:23S rRNA U2552 (ribose-2'-O)-methylase RlmE/FtsJ/DNA-directed RNA polymerase subunit E'/Rpb7